MGLFSFFFFFSIFVGLCLNCGLGIWEHVLLRRSWIVEFFVFY